MKTPLSFFTLILVSIAVALPLKAQDQPSATNIALATELVSVMHLEQSMGLGLGMAKQMQSKMANAYTTSSSPDTKSMMQKTMDTSMNAAASIMSWDKVKPMYISAYATTFTAEELQGAIDFYKTPVGQKWVEKQPQLSMAIMAKTTEMMMAAQPQMMDSIKKSMAALEVLHKSMNSAPTPLPSASPTN